MASYHLSSEVRRYLWSVYRKVPTPARALCALRPLICPFGPVLDFIPRGSTVLDVGCGSGTLLCLAARYREIERGVGVDVSARALGHARHASAVHGQLEFSTASTPDDWPEERFGVVTLVDVMHHVPRPARPGFFAAVLRRVAPGGLLVYKDMCVRPRWRAWANLLHDLVLARQLVSHQDPAAVVGWVERAGFELVHARAYSAAIVYGHVLSVFRSAARTDLNG